MALLEVDGVCVQFGGLKAITDLNLSVEEGSTFAVIGPNGAGKTTAFNVITGFCKPTSGQVRFEGARIDGEPAHRICARGIARTFQNIRLFNLTVLENIQAALIGAERSGWRDVLRGSGWRLREQQRRARAQALLEQLGLEKHASKIARSLAYADQRRVEIARALATATGGPRLLLLDEPAAGANPAEKEALRLGIAEIRERFGLTIMLIDHDVSFVMNLCERVAVLDHGEKIADGSPEEVRKNLKVKEAYLGPDDDSDPSPRPPSEGRVRSLQPMLSVSGLRVAYGGIVALRDVSIEVHKGEIVTLIGSNGAGKSTLLKALSGLVKPVSGRILFEGQDITQERADLRVARGLGQSPEGRRVFANLTVRENLAMGAYLRRANEAANLERVLKLFPLLRKRLEQASGTLSGGEQQMLAIGRALMGEPRVLLLDEPSLGLAPLIVRDIFNIIRDIHAEGTTVVLVEQNARQALRVAQHAYVLKSAEVTLEGAADEVERDPRVEEEFLGGPPPSGSGKGGERSPAPRSEAPFVSPPSGSAGAIAPPDEPPVLARAADSRRNARR